MKKSKFLMLMLAAAFVMTAILVGPKYLFDKQIETITDIYPRY